MSWKLRMNGALVATVLILLGTRAGALSTDTPITPTQLDDGWAKYVVTAKTFNGVTEFEVVITPKGARKLSAAKGANVELRDGGNNLVAKLPIESIEAMATLTTPDEKLTFHFSAAANLVANSTLEFWQSGYAVDKQAGSRTFVTPLPGSTMGSIRLQDFVKPK